MTATERPRPGVPRLARPLPHNQTFGPTFQGEGPHTGRLAYFVRLGHCNLKCGWCDTPDTWDGRRYDIDAHNPPTPTDLITAPLVDAPPQALVVITGGEPLIHQHNPHWYQLLDTIAARHRVAIETNGTVTPTRVTRRYASHITASPKLSNNAADPGRKRIKAEALGTLALLAQADTGPTVAFKFVVTAPADLDEVAALVNAHRIPAHAVWIMPEGRDTTTLLERHRDLADLILDRGWNTTTRLHTLLWEDDRNR